MCRGERNVYWKVRKTFTLIKMYESRTTYKMNELMSTIFKLRRTGPQAK
jgi:hypothetical protein